MRNVPSDWMPNVSRLISSAPSVHRVAFRSFPPSHSTQLMEPRFPKKTIISLKPTHSKTIFLQLEGFILNIDEGCVVFGFPSSICNSFLQRLWSLAFRLKVVLRRSRIPPNICTTNKHSF